MAIDVATVRKVARLSRIAEQEDALPGLAQKLNGIMQWIEQLGEVDTDGVEPMTSAVATTTPLREDVVTESDRHAAYQAIAPEVEAGLYLVPKVIE